MAKRDVHIEIVVPTEGLHYEAAPSIITPRSSPNLRANAYYGAVQKEYGTSLYVTGTIPATPNLLFEARFSNATVLEAFTHTGMYKQGSGTFASDGGTYTGTFTNFWSACMHNDKMIYTNGVELVQVKALSNTTGTNWGSVVASSFKAKSVVSFKEHLCMYNVTEAGNASPKRVQWSKVGLLSGTASDFTTGLANFVDVQNVAGDILTAVPMGGGTVIVYGEGSMHIQEWVGGTSVFLFTKLVDGIEIPSPRCITANDSIHYIMTRDNIYEYKGGRTLTPIGDPIQSHFLSIINKDHMNKSFLEYMREVNELHVWIPTSDSTPDTCLICKVTDNYSWYQVDRNATCAGRFKGGDSITIGDLVGNIGAQTWRFGDLRATGEAPIYLYAQADGHVVQKDVTRYSVISGGTAAAQTFLFDSKALSSLKDVDPLVRNQYNLSMYKDNDSRWIKAKVEAKGQGSMYLYYSTDEGVTFAQFAESPKTLDSEWKLLEFDCDVAAPTFMVRVTNTAANEWIAIDYMKVSFIPGAEAVQ